MKFLFIISCFVLTLGLALLSSPFLRATARTSINAARLKLQLPGISWKLAFNAANDAAPAEHIFALYPEAAHSANLVVKRGGTGAGYYDVCGASDAPIGFVEDTAESTTLTRTRSIFNWLFRRPVVLTASEAIAQDALVYTAANGKVQDEPATAGTYYLVGKASTAAAGDGKKLVVTPLPPVKLVVVAAFTSTNDTAAGAADLAALKAEAEKIGDDVRKLGTAFASAALVKVLAS